MLVCGGAGAGGGPEGLSPKTWMQGRPSVVKEISHNCGQTGRDPAVATTVSSSTGTTTVIFLVVVPVLSQ